MCVPSRVDYWCLAILNSPVALQAPKGPLSTIILGASLKRRDALLGSPSNAPENGIERSGANDPRKRQDALSNR